jgi:hypothetical protein
MNTNTQTLAWLAMLAILLPKQLSWGQEVRAVPPRELLSADATSCVFAGGEARFRYFGATGPVEWRLVAGNRTIGQGVAELTASGPNPAPQLAISVSLPTLHAGVILPAELRLSWNVAGKDVDLRQQVTIYSRDPFTNRKAAFEQAQIKLFDSAGETADVFERYNVPFKPLASLSAIDSVNEGVVIVGEGVSFREHRNLPESLLRAAERGVPVLCLAPVEGEFAFPQPDETASGPLWVVFEQGDAIRQFDKRFDLLPTISRLSVESHGSKAVVRVSGDGAGWSWLSVQFAAGAPKAPPHELIVCGLSVIRDWETSPVPRYLLVHLIDELTAAQSAGESERDEFTHR